MTQPPKPLPTDAELKPADEADTPVPPREPIVLRPDGYYWLAPDGQNEVGPFETFEDAQADLHAADEEAPEPGESLREAEAEIGIADWIDPETGEPAEGQSPPHLDQD